MEESGHETDRALESVQPARGGAVVLISLVGGVFGLGRINQVLPNIKLPVVVVVTADPGALPEAVDRSGLPSDQRAPMG
jgi:hypothetical protein